MRTEKLAEVNSPINPVCYTCKAHSLNKSGHYCNPSKVDSENKFPLICPRKLRRSTESAVNPYGILAAKIKKK